MEEHRTCARFCRIYRDFFDVVEMWRVDLDRCYVSCYAVEVDCGGEVGTTKWQSRGVELPVGRCLGLPKIRVVFEVRSSWVETRTD